MYEARGRSRPYGRPSRGLLVPAPSAAPALRGASLFAVAMAYPLFADWVPQSYLGDALNVPGTNASKAEAVREELLSQLRDLDSVRRFVEGYTCIHSTIRSARRCEMLITVIEQGSALWNFGVPHFGWLTKGGVPSAVHPTFSRGQVWLWEQTRLVDPGPLVGIMESVVFGCDQPPDESDVADPYKAVSLLQKMRDKITRAQRSGYTIQEMEARRPPDPHSDDNADYLDWLRGAWPPRREGFETVREWYELIKRLESDKLPAAAKQPSPAAPCQAPPCSVPSSCLTPSPAPCTAAEPVAIP